MILWHIVQSLSAKFMTCSFYIYFFPKFYHKSNLVKDFLKDTHDDCKNKKYAPHAKYTIMFLLFLYLVGLIQEKKISA